MRNEPSTNYLRRTEPEEERLPPPPEDGRETLGEEGRKLGVLRDTLGALRETGGELREMLGGLGVLERKVGVLRETGGDELTVGRETLGDDGRKLGGELEGRMVCELGVLGRG